LADTVYGFNPALGYTACFTPVNRSFVSSINPYAETFSAYYWDNSFVAQCCGNMSWGIRNPSPPSISGYKWNDLNGNGRWDSGEPGLPNWHVALYRGGDQVGQTETDASGHYSFALNAEAGFRPNITYEVRELAQPGWVPTTATSRWVYVPEGVSSAGHDYKDNDFGNTRPDTTVGISVNPVRSDTGDPVVWTVTEKNTGEVTISSPYVNVNDASADSAAVARLTASSPDFSGDNGNGVLDPGETWRWTLGENPKQAEHYYAFGHGRDPLGGDVSLATGYVHEAADAALVVDHPDTAVGVSVNPTRSDTGDPVTWTVTENNTGDVPISSAYVDVNDTNADGTAIARLTADSPNFSGDNGDGVLDQGETWSWTIAENPTANEHYYVFGHGIDMIGRDVSVDTGHPGETADATLTVNIGTATRTWGFYKTHYAYDAVLFARLDGKMDLGWNPASPLTDLSDVMGVLFSDPAHNTQGVRRNARSQAIISTSHQLTAAIFNTQLPHGAAVPNDPVSHVDLITATRRALAAPYSADSTAEIIRLGSLLDAYNNSGDSIDGGDSQGMIGKATPKLDSSQVRYAIPDAVTNF
jgi:hypothetical protein